MSVTLDRERANPSGSPLTIFPSTLLPTPLPVRVGFSLVGEFLATAAVRSGLAGAS